MENEENSPFNPISTPATTSTWPQKIQPSLPALIAAIGFSLGMVFAGGAVAYHFLVNIPQTERTAANIRSQELEAQTKRDQESQMRTVKAESEYQICLDAAQSDYANRWDAHCATISAERERSYNNCVQRNLGDTSYCTYVQRIPSSNCQLPSITAEAYDAANQQAKQQCLDARNAVLTVTQPRF